MDAADQGGEALPQVAALGDLVGGSCDEDAPLVDDGNDACTAAGRSPYMRDRATPRRV